MKRTERLLAATLVVVAMVCGCGPRQLEAPTAGLTSAAEVEAVNMFARFQGTGSFTRQLSRQGEAIYLSPLVRTPVPWHELVVSWNASPSTGLVVEAMPIGSDSRAIFHGISQWSLNPEQFVRSSLNDQNSSDAWVKTDTLVLAAPASAVRLRLTVVALDKQVPSELKLVTASFASTAADVPESAPNKAAWGTEIKVPKKAQLSYSGGDKWCSPACISMVLGYWTERLHRLELKADVPEVAKAVFDPGCSGTGNWSFNAAYVGSFSGLEACVQRLRSLTEVENEIATGRPVIISVAHDVLTGKQRRGTGHLIVVTGFTAHGDVIVNDPWTKDDAKVRKVYPRTSIIEAWRHSHNAAYLIKPVSP